MRNKRMLYVLLVVLATACVAVIVSKIVKQSQDILRDVVLLDEEKMEEWRENPGRYAIRFQQYSKEENKTFEYMIYELEEAEIFFEYINKLPVRKVKEGTKIDYEQPLYGIQVNDGEYNLYISWQDGIWFDDQGDFYQVDLNVEEIIDKFTWDRILDWSGNLIRNRYNRALFGGEWQRELLEPAKDLSNKRLELVMESLEDRIIAVRLVNPFDSTVTYGRSYSIQVKLDEQWYDVPCKLESLGFFLIPYSIGGLSNELLRFDLSYWGPWPEGLYRFVLSGEYTAEFYWEGDMEEKIEAIELPESPYDDNNRNSDVNATMEYDYYSVNADGVAFTLENPRGRSVYYSDQMMLERYHNGQWYSVPKKDEKVFSQDVHTLGAGETAERYMDLAWYDHTYTPGYYRVVMECSEKKDIADVQTEDRQIIFAMFEIRDVDN